MIVILQIDKTWASFMWNSKLHMIFDDDESGVRLMQYNYRVNDWTRIPLLSPAGFALTEHCHKHSILL